MKEKMKSIKRIALYSLLSFVIIYSEFIPGTNPEIDSVTSFVANVGSYKSPAELTSNGEKRVYLSDLNYITSNNWSYNGWAGHSIQHDKNQENGKLSLMINGERTYFTKGVSVHAKGQVTYDISELSTQYPRFVAYIGVDGSRGSNGDLWIRISVSKDGVKWEEKIKTSNMKGTTPAVDVDIDIEGYKYLRIYADPNGGNAADHATIANARLITKDFDKDAPYYNKIHTVEYYDSILKNYSVEENYNNNYRLVLERELVNKLGYSNIQDLAEFKKGFSETLNWYLDSNERIEQIIEVGEISNTTNFMTILTDIYNKYQLEFSGENGLVYAKMSVGLAATYTTDVILSPLRFGGYAANYDYVERFTLMKQLFDENKFMRVVNNGKAGEMVQNDWFKDYHVELIRMIMRDGIRGDELIWLNEYTHYKKSFSEGMVPYLSPNYNQAKLYAEENREKYNQKYLLEQYGVPYNDGIQRYWMVFEAGGICWDQSRIGQSMWKVNGLPAVGAYQPGHEMYFTYYQDNNGNGYWSERYGNYNGAGTTWGGGQRNRLIFNWGAKSFTDQNIGGSKGGTSLGYLYLAQANLNNYDKYKKSLYYNLIANSYEDNNKKIETYFKALEVNDTNLDSYDYIIKLYKAMSDKNAGGTITSDDWYDLALKVTDGYKYYPVAMYDLLNVIRPYLEGEKKLDIDRIEKENLNAAVNVSNETLNSIGAVNAGSGVRTHAKVLLGKAQPDPMSFSFDGENGGKIVKNPLYALHWAYSLDGGLTFSDFTEEDSVALTAEEIEKLTAENDIIIKFMGLNDYSFTIDIINGVIPDDLFASDLENKIVGTTTALEWRFQDTDDWTKLSDEEPDLTGDKTVQVRVGRTGNKLPTSTLTYNFTADVDNAKRKYVSVSHISLENVSTEATSSSQKGNAVNALDANYNTRWHSNWNGSDTQRYITIKLDEPRFISAVEFVPAGGGNGKIIDGIIYGSVDGEEWVELTRKTNLTYTNQANTNADAIKNTKSFDIEDPQKVQYIKIQATRASNGNWFTARAFNLYEDKTIVKVADFSFDGQNAGKISLVEEQQGKEWQYSLDGGTTWKNGESDSHQLTKEEINEITSENGIRIKIAGDETKYIINIHKSSTPSINPYLNDLENRLINITGIENLEWKIDDGEWTSYQEKEPIVTGTRKLYIRTKATRNYAASDAIEYQFTEDNQENNAKYIPISHLTIDSFSSETIRPERNQLEYAKNSIDGNINTMWHTSRVATDDKKFIVIKLDEARYISKIQYNKQAGYSYGVPKNGIIYVSMDGENWEIAETFENLYNPANKAELIADENQKDIVIKEPKLALYIKIQVTKSCDYVNGSKDGVPFDYFFAATMLNLFEDTTKKLPEETIQYSVTTKTNQDVVATIVSENEITVTNNNGRKEYIFTENGKFTFEYTDKYGREKTITAIVDWIDKDAPIGTINYSTRDLTNEDVIVTLETNELVTITNNEGKNTYIFTEKGEFTFEFIDEAGNKGTATAIVDWIDKDAPTARIEYSTTNPTNNNVIAKLIVDDDVKITNNNSSKEYIFTENGTFKFEFVDKAGNFGSITATVTNIDKTSPTASVIYSKTDLTNENVIVTLVNPSEEITITNNNGSNSYTFTENGEFTFEFVDKAGNIGTITAKVENIDKTAPTAKVEYSTTELTNEDVIVTLVNPSEEITITNNNGSNVYTFTENGEFTFEFIDKAGNIGTVTAKVTNINKVAPTARIEYSTTDLTNKDVVVTLVDASNEITITNNGGKNTYTFKENGNFTFEFVDKYGNKGSITATVTNIDKIAPTAKIEYSTTDLTNKDVIVTLVNPSEEITIINNNSLNVYTFTENGEFTFEFVDKAGNIGTVTAIVNNIDKIVPTAKIEYSTTEFTNQNVIATLVDVSEEITILNNEGKNEYIFTKNGTFTFEFVDKAGNKGTITAIVRNINKEAPTAKVEYSTTDLTNKDVIVTLVDASDEITITNNDGKNTYTFTKNGEFTFEFVDKYGNKGSIIAVVNNIDKDAPIGTIIYSTKDITDDKVIVTLETNEPVTIINNNGLNTYTFTENGEFTFEFVDKSGNHGAATANVTWIIEGKEPFEVKFDNKDVTDKSVTVTLELEEGVTIINNGGSNTYTFTENGEFTFEYSDKKGNVRTYVVKVDWIKKYEKPEQPNQPEKPEIPTNPSESNKNEGIIETPNKTESNNKQDSSSIKDKDNMTQNNTSETNDETTKPGNDKEENENKPLTEKEQQDSEEVLSKKSFKFYLKYIIASIIGFLILIILLIRRKEKEEQ